MSIIFGIFDKRGQGFDKHWLYTMETVLEHGFRPDRIKNNPRPVSRDDLREILRGIC